MLISNTFFIINIGILLGRLPTLPTLIIYNYIRVLCYVIFPNVLSCQLSEAELCDSSCYTKINA